LRRVFKPKRVFRTKQIGEQVGVMGGGKLISSKGKFVVKTLAGTEE